MDALSMWVVSRLLVVLRLRNRPSNRKTVRMCGCSAVAVDHHAKHAIEKQGCKQKCEESVTPRYLPITTAATITI